MASSKSKVTVAGAVPVFAFTPNTPLVEKPTYKEVTIRGEEPHPAMSEMEDNGREELQRVSLSDSEARDAQRKKDEETYFEQQTQNSEDDTSSEEEMGAEEYKTLSSKVHKDFLDQEEAGASRISPPTPSLDMREETQRIDADRINKGIHSKKSDTNDHQRRSPSGAADEEDFTDEIEAYRQALENSLLDTPVSENIHNSSSSGSSSSRTPTSTPGKSTGSQNINRIQTPHTIVTSNTFEGSDAHLALILAEQERLAKLVEDLKKDRMWQNSVAAAKKGKKGTPGGSAPSKSPKKRSSKAISDSEGWVHTSSRKDLPTTTHTPPSPDNSTHTFSEGRRNNVVEDVEEIEEGELVVEMPDSHKPTTPPKKIRKRDGRKKVTSPKKAVEQTLLVPPSPPPRQVIISNTPPQSETGSLRRSPRNHPTSGTSVLHERKHRKAVVLTENPTATRPQGNSGRLPGVVEHTNTLQSTSQTHGVQDYTPLPRNRRNTTHLTYSQPPSSIITHAQKYNLPSAPTYRPYAITQPPPPPTAPPPVLTAITPVSHSTFQFPVPPPLASIPATRQSTFSMTSGNDNQIIPAAITIMHDRLEKRLSDQQQALQTLTDALIQQIQTTPKQPSTLAIKPLPTSRYSFNQKLLNKDFPDDTPHHPTTPLNDEEHSLTKLMTATPETNPYDSDSSSSEESDKEPPPPYHPHYPQRHAPYYPRYKDPNRKRVKVPTFRPLVITKMADHDNWFMDFETMLRMESVGPNDWFQVFMSRVSVQAEQVLRYCPKKNVGHYERTRDWVNNNYGPRAPYFDIETAVRSLPCKGLITVDLFEEVNRLRRKFSRLCNREGRLPNTLDGQMLMTVIATCLPTEAIIQKERIMEYVQNRDSYRIVESKIMAQLVTGTNVRSNRFDAPIVIFEYGKEDQYIRSKTMPAALTYLGGTTYTSMETVIPYENDDNIVDGFGEHSFNIGPRMKERMRESGLLNTQQKDISNIETAIQLSSSADKRCFYCNQAGHFKRECPVMTFHKQKGLSLVKDNNLRNNQYRNDNRVNKYRQNYFINNRGRRFNNFRPRGNIRFYRQNNFRGRWNNRGNYGGNYRGNFRNFRGNFNRQRTYVTGTEIEAVTTQEDIDMDQQEEIEVDEDEGKDFIDMTECMEDEQGNKYSMEDLMDLEFIPLDKDSFRPEKPPETTFFSSTRSAGEYTIVRKPTSS